MQSFFSPRRYLPKKVTFRLTLFHIVLFGLASLVVFVLIHLSLSYTLLVLTDKYLQGEAKEEERLFTTNGIGKLQSEFANESLGEKRFTVFYALLSPRREILASSDLSPWRDFSFIPKDLGDLKEGATILLTLPRPAHAHKARVLAKRLPGGPFLIIGKSLRDNDEILERVREIFGYGFLSMLLLGAFLGWLLSKRAMAGVERITKTALQIDRGDLSRRVPIGNEGEEIQELARAFNNMLNRVQLLVEDMERVTNDVAHDLRSPLARIRGMAESALAHPKNPQDFQDMAGAIVEECDRLVRLINTMLEIAQADSGLAKFSRTPIDIRGIIREAEDLFQPVAEDKGLRLSATLPNEPLVVQGDKAALRRIIANLLDNAVKFSKEDGRIVVEAEKHDGEIVIEVRDTGIGIAPNDLPHIFERFYRGDKSRATRGHGLGLSLTSSLVHTLGGKIEAQSVPGKGSKFHIHLPSKPILS